MSSLCIEKERIWFVDRKINALFYYDVRNSHVELVHVIDPNHLYKAFDYYQLVCINGKVILAPRHSKEGFFEYNIKSKESKFIPLKKEKITMNENTMLFDCVIEEQLENVYFIGREYPAIVEYDNKSDSYIYYNSYIEHLHRYDLEVHGASGYFVSAVCVENSIYLPLYKTNMVMRFDLQTKNVTYHKIGGDKNEYYQVIAYGKYLLISQIKPGKSIVRWNIATNEVKEFCDYPLECDFAINHNEYNGFAGMAVYEGELFLFPDFSNMILEINVQTGKMKKNEWVIDLKKINRSPGGTKIFDCVKQVDNLVYATVPMINVMYCIDLKRKKVQELRLHIDQYQWEKCLKQLNNLEFLYDERGNLVERIPPIDFMFALKQEEISGNNTDSSIGRGIYNFIMKD